MTSKPKQLDSSALALSQALVNITHPQLTDYLDQRNDAMRSFL